MSNLTEFQNNLILDLQKEFIRLNPTPAKSGKFTLEAVKQDIDHEKVFRDSILSYNRTIAEELEQDFYNQIMAFNKEFVPLRMTWGTSGNSDKADKMFKDEYSMKTPQHSEIGLFFNGDVENGGVKLYVLFDYEQVKIETTSNIITLNKIKGLIWTRRCWTQRDNSGAPMYQTFDEFTQNDKSFQQAIVSKFKHLTK